MRDWLNANKTWVGGGLLAVFVYLQMYPPTTSKAYTVTMGVIGAFLLGAGILKSDKFYKDRK